MRDAIQHNKAEQETAVARSLTRMIFVVYLLLLAYGMLSHELWGDELHSWNIARGSRTLGELLHNVRYEGHPPAWHVLLWLITRVTHDLFWLQAAQYFFAASAIFLLLFRSSFSPVSKVLLPFGYYFLYEYGVLSRNYAMAVLFAFLLCCLLQDRLRKQWYYPLLFLLSMTHMLGLLLAAGLHLYALASGVERPRKKMVAHLLTGILVLLPAAYFIMPPANSQLDAGFWMKHWSFSRIIVDLQSPLRAFMPMPAWWQQHYWNTHFLLDLNSSYPLLKYSTPFLSLGCIAWASYYLRSDRRSLLLFLTNVALTLLLGFVFPLTTQRYTGFIFIGFIVACWLKGPGNAQERKNVLFNLLLGFQALSGVFMMMQDIRLPFSNMHRVKELVRSVPGGQRLVTDNWALNALSAYTGHAYYCTDLQREAGFLMWEKEPAYGVTNRYSAGLHYFMEKEKVQAVYMISVKPLPLILAADDRLSTLFSLCPVAQVEGAVEKSSNLYLYRITEKPAAKSVK